jgi:hypothetical protein
MNKKLVLKPPSITMGTHGQWTYTTLRPLKARMSEPRSLPKSRAIYYPKSGKRREQLREREDVHFRPLLCHPMPAAPLS